MTESRWRRLGLEHAPGQTLLRRGLALLDDLAADPVPTLRWYVPDDATVVLGRGQRPDRVAGSPLPLLARGSGGGAVLLGPDLLSLDVLLPAGHPWLAGDVAAAFDPIGEAWRLALADLGVPDPRRWTAAGTARRRGTPAERALAEVCYATLGRGEVTVAGRKLVGLAQRRRRPGALVQCGLLLAWRPDPLIRALGVTAHHAAITRAAVGLDELLPAPPPPSAVIDAVERRLLDLAATWEPPSSSRPTAAPSPGGGPTPPAPGSPARAPAG